MPPTDAYNPESTRHFYDRISKAYDAIADSGEHDARMRGIAALKLSAGESVLDIGFGTGSAIVDLARAVGDGGVVMGIDISPGMRDVAAEKIKQHNIKAKVDLAVGDARKLPYAEASLDAVFSSFTLELFPAEDIPAVLAESRRVLKPGGRLGVVSMATVAEGQGDSAMERAYKWFHHHFPHIVDCRPIDATGYVRDAGFEISHDERIEIWTMPVAIVVGRKA